MAGLISLQHLLLSHLWVTHAMHTTSSCQVTCSYRLAVFYPKPCLQYALAAPGLSVMPTGMSAAQRAAHSVGMTWAASAKVGSCSDSRGIDI